MVPAHRIKAEAPRLRRALSTLALTGLVVNCVVGAGVLGLPGKVYALAGNLTYAVLGAAALLALACGLCLAELGSRYAETGGPVVYVEHAFGSLAGFTVGWLLWTATVLAAASLLGLMAATLRPYAAAWGLGHIAVLAILAAIFTGNALAGITQSAIANNALTMLKLALLATGALLGLFFVPSAPPAPLVGSMAPAPAIVLLFFAFVGFERPTALAGEMRSPEKAVPIALISGSVIVTALYAAVFAASLRGAPDLATNSQPLTAIAERALGAGWSTAITGATLVILAGTIASQWITAPRLLFAMAESGELPSIVAHVEPRRRTPAVAIVLTGSAAFLLALAGDFSGTISASSASRLVIFMICGAALIRLRSDPTAPQARFRLPGGAFLAAVTIVGCIAALAFGAANEIGRLIALTAIGLGVRWLSASRRG